MVLRPRTKGAKKKRVRQQEERRSIKKKIPTYGLAAVKK